MEEFSIQRFARRSGVSMDRLRNYEKENLLSPRREQNNQYRTFTDRDLVDLQMICYLHSMDIPIREMNFADHAGTPEAVQKNINQRISMLEAQINIMQQHVRMLRKIQARIREMTDADVGCRDWLIQPRYVLNYDDAQQAGRYDLIEEWMTFMPFVASHFSIPAEEFRNDGTEMPARIGLQLVKYHVNTLPIRCEAPVKEEPESHGVRGFVYMRDPLFPTAKDFAPVLDYMRMTGQRPAGDWMYGVRGIDVDENGKKYYVRVLVPTQPV